LVTLIVPPAKRTFCDASIVAVWAPVPNVIVPLSVKALPSKISELDWLVSPLKPPARRAFPEASGVIVQYCWRGTCIVPAAVNVLVPSNSSAEDR
jgi:hypothetical protein